MGGFSVTMENVSQNWAYVIFITTVEKTAMNLFVVGVPDLILVFRITSCVGLQGHFRLRLSVY